MNLGPTTVHIDEILKAELERAQAECERLKTAVAACLIAMRKVNTLVLVHRRQLMDQWREQLALFLGLNIKDIGQIGGGKTSRTAHIDIAVMQSLVRKGEFKDLVTEYGQVIVDICHHVSAFTKAFDFPKDYIVLLLSFYDGRQRLCEKPLIVLSVRTECVPDIDRGLHVHPHVGTVFRARASRCAISAITPRRSWQISFTVRRVTPMTGVSLVILLPPPGQPPDLACVSDPQRCPFPPTYLRTSSSTRLLKSQHLAGKVFIESSNVVRAVVEIQLVDLAILSIQSDSQFSLEHESRLYSVLSSGAYFCDLKASRELIRLAAGGAAL